MTSPLRILLVEDNPGDVYLFRNYLSESGIDYLLTHSGNLGDTIMVLADQKFDVVLLDLGLPESSGLETLEKINLREIESPVIVLTGLDNEETSLMALKEGAQDYLVKDKLNSENIIRAIRYSIERKRNQEALSLSEKRYRELSECLEIKVEERTKDLEKTNNSLTDEIEERIQIEESLRHSEERYRSLIELSPNAIFVNRNNRVELLNQAAIELFGATGEEQIIGKPPFEFFHPDYHHIISERIDLLLKGHKVPLTEEKILRLDGDIRDVEVIGALFTDDEGPAIQVILHDITQRKKKEEELKKLNRTLKALGKSSQAMIRARDELTYMNDVCRIVVEDCGYAMLWIGLKQNDRKKTVKPVAHAGFDHGYLETLKVTWDDTERGQGPTGTAIRTGEVSICRDMFNDPKFSPWREEAIKRGYTSIISLPLLDKGETFGSITLYSEEGQTFADDEISLLSEIASDLAYGITVIRSERARTKAEEQLRKNAADLKELNATKDKFFRIIAHDLRNPFFALLGSAEILAKNAHLYNMEGIANIGKIMYNSAKSAHSLLENLLEWSRSQAGDMKFNPVTIPLTDLVSENIANLKVVAASKNIGLFSDVPNSLGAYADVDMLSAIVRNLLSNAIKFTAKEGKVSVHAKSDMNDVVITVKDTGTGISSEDIGKLFRIDTVYRTPGTENEKGTGLGLILCKEFVEKHGGKIWVESTVGSGSKFIFTLPGKRN